MKALDQSLTSALQSREQRAIRRRLPQPPPSPPPIDFSSNDYLSLATSPSLRDAFLRAAAAAPHGELLGSGGSRLLVPQRAHAALEARLAKFFDAPSALLFNSGFDANAGLFACVPQAGDAVILDELIHASVHDGVRASRVRDAQYNFANNDVRSFKHACERVLRDRPGAVDGKSSVFVAVESVYSMDGTFAPLKEIVDLLEHYFPCGNAYLIVDEAHATGIYGPNGAGRVAELGLQHRVFARLHTFGKALAGTGGALPWITLFQQSRSLHPTAILLVPPLVRDYLVNYARPLIYTTALSYANVIAANCSFDMLENGSASKVRTSTSLFPSPSDQPIPAFRATPFAFVALPVSPSTAPLQHPSVPSLPPSRAHDFEPGPKPTITDYPRAHRATSEALGVPPR